MATSSTFFPVGNGDMTLICLGDKAGKTILIDCNIRAAADDPNDKTRDVDAERCRGPQRVRPEGRDRGVGEFPGVIRQICSEAEQGCQKNVCVSKQ